MAEYESGGEPNWAELSQGFPSAEKPSESSEPKTVTIDESTEQIEQTGRVSEGVESEPKNLEQLKAELIEEYNANGLKKVVESYRSAQRVSIEDMHGELGGFPTLSEKYSDFFTRLKDSPEAIKIIFDDVEGDSNISYPQKVGDIRIGRFEGDNGNIYEMTLGNFKKNYIDNQSK